MLKLRSYRSLNVAVQSRGDGLEVRQCYLVLYQTTHPPLNTSHNPQTTQKITATMPSPTDPPPTAPLADLTITPLPPKKPHVPSLKYPSNRKTIYDRNLNRTKTSEISLASFSYLFNSLISYHHSRSPSVSELETRLNRAGYPIGIKMLDLLLYRQEVRRAQRPTRLLDMLQFVHGTLWRSLFNRAADALEQSTSKKNEYMIVDNEPVVNTFISIPKEMSQLNCAAFVAGIIEACVMRLDLELRV